MLVAAAFIPGTPMLVPSVASGAAPELAELRASALAAVGSLLAHEATEIVILGIAPRTGPYPAVAQVDFGGFGVLSSVAAADDASLPRALSVGRWVLDRVLEAEGNPDLPVTSFGVTSDAPPARCHDLGAALAERSDRVVVVVVGDGSARRTAKAPGSFDEGATSFDDLWMAALATADLPALDGMDEASAHALMVEGRAPWQVASGMAAGGTWASSLATTADPYGVQYAVATWARSPEAEPSEVTTP